MKKYRRSSGSFAALLIGLLIGLLAFAVRLKGISGIDLGLDGGLSLALAALPLAEALKFLGHDVHPPLFYLLLRPWIGLVGAAPFAAKFLGVCSGTLTVVVLFGWVRSIAGTRAASGASLILAVSPVAVAVDLTVREYALAILLMLLAVWAGADRSPRGRIRFVALEILAVWTSYLALTVPLVSGLDALTRRDRRRLLDAAAVGATLLPWLGFAAASGFLRVFQGSGPRQRPATADPLPIQVGDLLRMLDGGTSLRPEWLGPALLGVAVIALLRGRPRGGKKRAPPAWLLIALLSGVAAVAVNSFWTREGLGVRYVAPALPFVFAGLGYGFAQQSRRAPAAAALALLLLVVPNGLGTLAWFARPTLPPSFWDPVALVATLDAQTASNDGVVFVSAEQAGYYQALSQRPRRWVLLPAGTDYLQGNISQRARATLPGLAQRSRVVWFVVYRGVSGAGTAKVGDWLSLHGFAATPLAVPDSEIDPYVSGSPSRQGVSAHFSGAEFASGVRLLGADFPTTIQPGGVLPVELDWQAGHPLARNLKVFVHLIDRAGKVVSQHDSPPVNGRAPFSQWRDNQIIVDGHGLFVPTGLVPGHYWLEIGLYDEKGRLPLQNGGDALRRGPLVVR